MSKKLILTPNAYKTDKVYAVKPINGTGDFDFVRNTGRTRVNVNANIEALSNNIVALDHQNGCPEILLEPQRTNQIKYSDDLTDVLWAKRQTTITANDTVSPDGNVTADKIVENTDDDFHRIRYNKNVDANIDLTFSCFLKAAETTKARVTFGGVLLTSNATNNLKTIIDLTNGNIIAEFYNIKVEAYTNNWYQVSIKITTPQAGTLSTFIELLNENENASYLGDGSSGFFVWGAQLEEGEKPTSYIPTNGSTVTRNKDILRKDLTPIIDPTYTAFIEVVGDEGRLKIEDNDTGIDLPLNGSGKIAIQVDSQIKIIFPDNGQPQTELIYDKPDDLRNIDIVSKLAATRIGVIAIEDGIQDVSNWISGDVSSYFIETDWSAETDLQDEFRQQDWDYFPAIDFGNGTNFKGAWQNNNLTSFPANMFDTNTTSNYTGTFRSNDLDQASVDNILISVNTSAQANNITNGRIDIDFGTSATPSATGQAAADALFANGWTVDLNGYTPS